MSISISYLMNKNSVALMSETQSRIFSSDTKEFEKARELILRNDEPALYALLNEFKETVEKSYEGFRVDNGVVFIEDEQVPDYLGKRLKEIADASLPYKYILNFWNRVKLNPSWRSVNCLFDFLDHNHVEFYGDDSGRIVLWKAVRNDFKDKWTGKISNKPGETVEIPRNQVEDDPSKACAHGLHGGSPAYAKDYATSDDRLIRVLVDPVDVVSVPSDSNFGKLRMCRYEVLDEIEREKELPTEQILRATCDGCDNVGKFEEDEDDSDKCDDPTCECHDDEWEFDEEDENDEIDEDDDDDFCPVCGTSSPCW